MARPIKNGLLYFPLDTDFFQDKKIKVLKGRYGSNGICVYLYLLCEIYKSGYYITLDDDLVLCLSGDLNISEDLTRQIISFLLGRSLLTEINVSTLAKSDAVLTAKSIQRRYQEAMKGLKRDIAVKAEYWILNENETLSFIKVFPENNKSKKNNNKSEENNSKSEINPTNKIRRNKTRRNEIERQTEPRNFSVVSLSDDERAELVRLSDSLSVEVYIKKIIAWQQEKKRMCSKPFITIKKWIEEDKAKPSIQKPRKETSYDLDEWEEFAMNFDPREGGRK